MLAVIKSVCDHAQIQSKVIIIGSEMEFIFEIKDLGRLTVNLTILFALYHVSCEFVISLKILSWKQMLSIFLIFLFQETEFTLYNPS